jgi:hypothetical protein
MTTQHFADVAKELKMKESKKNEETVSSSGNQVDPRNEALGYRTTAVGEKPLVSMGETTGFHRLSPNPVRGRARRHGRPRLAQVNGRAQVSAGERKR